MEPPKLFHFFLLLVIVVGEVASTDFSLENDFNSEFSNALFQYEKKPLPLIPELDYPFAKAIGESYSAASDTERENIKKNNQNVEILVFDVTGISGNLAWVTLNGDNKYRINELLLNGVVGLCVGHDIMETKANSLPKKLVTVVLCPVLHTVIEQTKLQESLKTAHNEKTQLVADIQATKVAQMANSPQALIHELGTEYGFFVQPFVQDADMEAALELLNDNGEPIIYHLDDLSVNRCLSSVTLGCIRVAKWPNAETEPSTMALVVVYTLVSGALEPELEERMLTTLSEMHVNLQLTESTPMATKMAQLRASLLKIKMMTVRVREAVEVAITYILPLATKLEIFESEWLLKNLEITIEQLGKETEDCVGVGFGKKQIDATTFHLIITFLRRPTNYRLFGNCYYNPAGLVSIQWGTGSDDLDILFTAGIPETMPMPLGHSKTIECDISKINRDQDYTLPANKSIAVVFRYSADKAVIYLCDQGDSYQLPQLYNIAQEEEIRLKAIKLPKADKIVCTFVEELALSKKFMEVAVPSEEMRSAFCRWLALEWKAINKSEITEVPLATDEAQDLAIKEVIAKDKAINTDCQILSAEDLPKETRIFDGLLYLKVADKLLGEDPTKAAGIFWKTENNKTKLVIAICKK